MFTLIESDPSLFRIIVPSEPAAVDPRCWVTIDLDQRSLIPNGSPYPQGRHKIITRPGAFRIVVHIHILVAHPQISHPSPAGVALAVWYERQGGGQDGTAPWILTRPTVWRNVKPLRRLSSLPPFPVLTLSQSTTHPQRFQASINYPRRANLYIQPLPPANQNRNAPSPNTTCRSRQHSQPSPLIFPFVPTR